MRSKILTILAVLIMVLIQLLVILLATAERGYMAVGGEFGVLLFFIGFRILKGWMNEN